MKRSTMLAWLRLVRPPNLPTVPGDPLVGFLLAGALWDWSALWVSLAATLLYAAGLILNDVADISVDRLERPERSLPSKSLSVHLAALVGFLLLGGGVALAFLVGTTAASVALALGLLILCYNFATRRGSMAGLLTMGLCRSVSVGLGIAAAVPRLAQAPAAAWQAAAGIGCYIVAVSLLATGETKQQPLGLRRWLPPLLAIAAILPVIALATAAVSTRLLALLCALLALVIIGRATWLMGAAPPPALLGKAIGSQIRALLPLQAAYCALTPHGWPAVLALLLLLPLSSRLGRHFHAS